MRRGRRARSLLRTHILEAVDFPAGLLDLAVGWSAVTIQTPHAASGWRIHCGVEVTESSTNKQHSLYKVVREHRKMLMVLKNPRFKG